jgi:hypothetical protein
MNLKIGDIIQYNKPGNYWDKRKARVIRVSINPNFIDTWEVEDTITGGISTWCKANLKFLGVKVVSTTRKAYLPEWL